MTGDQLLGIIGIIIGSIIGTIAGHSLGKWLAEKIP